MHIPENYLSPSTCAVTAAVMLPVWKRALTTVRTNLPPERMPLLGIGAGFSFLVMMLNLPLPGGTTGHAVGAALLAILLGPAAACLSVSAALIVQAVFFGDGGILAIGANCLTMATIIPWTASAVYRSIRGTEPSPTREGVAAFAAGYLSLNLAAFVASLLFGIQPALFRDAAGLPLYAPYPLSVAIPAMMIPHLLVAGLVEGAVTVLALAYLRRTAPELLARDASPSARISWKPLLALLALMILLTPLGLLATGTAWGEWDSEQIREMLGFVPAAMERGFSFEAPIPDYAVPNLHETLGYLLSAVSGTALLLALFAGLRKLRASRGA